MKLNRLAGATSNIFQIFIRDKTSTTGAGLTGLVFNTSGLTAYFHRDTDTTATAITLVTMTVGTFTSSGFKEVDSTNMPGWYQFCPPNAAIASGAKNCAFHLKAGGNMADTPFEVQLTSYDPDDATRLGLTALPNGAMRWKKNAAIAGFSFPMYDSSGGLVSGATVTAQVVIDGAALASMTNAAAGISNGLYKIDVAAADVNGNNITFYFTAAGCVPTVFSFQTQP